MFIATHDVYHLEVWCLLVIWYLYLMGLQPIYHWESTTLLSLGLPSPICEPWCWNSDQHLPHIYGPVMQTNIPYMVHRGIGTSPIEIMWIEYVSWLPAGNHETYSTHIISGWDQEKSLVGGIPTPLKQMKVSWSYYSQYMENCKTTNQKDMPCVYICLLKSYCMYISVASAHGRQCSTQRMSNQ